MKYRSTNPDWRVPRGLRSADGDWGAPIMAESTIGEWVWISPTIWNLNLMCAMSSAVMQCITVEGQNSPWYLSWENLTVTFFPVAYSDNAQWIAAAASAIICGVRGWKNWDVVGCCPKLWAVKNNWWYIKSSTSIRVNQDFLSSMIFGRYASSNRSSLIKIRSSVSDPKSNW